MIGGTYSNITKLKINANWGSASGVSPDDAQLQIRGNYPSITFRSVNSNKMWLRHMDSAGQIQHYYAAGTDSTSWSIKHTMQIDGTFISQGSMRAPIFYDSNDTTYYVNPAGSSLLSSLVVNGNITPYTSLTASLGGSSNIWNKTFTRYIESNAGAARVKFSVWSGLTYGYGMQAGYTYGALDNEYALTSQMSNTDGRGWWWGDNGHTNAQGAMSLNTRGRLTVATSVRLGYGEGDTTNVPSYALDVSGSIRATSDVIAFSDRRVKENIVTIDNALEKVTKLRGVSYTRKVIEDKSTKVGVIAQEVLKVLPEVVSIDDEDKHSVSYGNMAGVFIEAIKELKTEIDNLKQEIKTLKNN